MKKIFLLLAVCVSLSAGAQSLKDALFGGKLKNDSGSVVRKSDDLRTKIDSNRKAPATTETVKPGPAKTEPNAANNTANNTAPVSATATPAADSSQKAAPRDNNKIWKEFTDAVIGTLKSDVMTSKKIKKGEYTIMLDYAIETDGRITITNVYPTPENKFLEEQVRERFAIDTPQLNPVPGSGGKPRKVMKRFNFTLVKE